MIRANTVLFFLGEHKKKQLVKVFCSITLQELENKRSMGWETSLTLANPLESWGGKRAK